MGVRYHQKLSDAKVRKAKCPPEKRQIKLSDGRGLYLLVTASGGKYWRFNYRFHGKQRTCALGVYPDVTLAMARERLQRARTMLAQGRDPSRSAARCETFAELHARWLVSRRNGLAPRTLRNIELRSQPILRAIGHLPINAIDAPTVLSFLRSIEDSGHVHTAHRMRGIIGQVLRYAIACGIEATDVTVALRGALRPERARHRAAVMTMHELRRMLADIRAYRGSPSTMLALEMLMRTFVRPGELRLATWDEIDIEAGIWRVPASRLKIRGRGDHIVPLSRQALECLRFARQIHPHATNVFPGRDIRRPMSDATLIGALNRMGWPNQSAHGFRASARSLLAEAGWPVEAIERQLAHAPKDRIAAAYARAEYLETRRRMMQAWSDWIDGVSDGRLGNSDS